MNKILKGAIAGAAGVALLAGGAGTFAYWNASSSVAPSGSIIAGNLAISDSGAAGVWTTASGTVVTLASFKAVPGDVLTYTKTMAIVATGNNLVATLALGPAAVTGVSAAAADVALASYLTKTVALTASGTGIASNGAGGYTITAGTAGVSQNVTVAATFTFPKDAGAATENNTKLGQVNLSNLTLALTQN